MGQCTTRYFRLVSEDGTGARVSEVYVATDKEDARKYAQQITRERHSSILSIREYGELVEALTAEDNNNCSDNINTQI